jgi:molybdate transport system regulatory protein
MLRAMHDETGLPQFRIRLVFGPDEMLGPGKAELLERIGRTGSIAAAGREMGMSYKRAWMLVETMNAMFRDPVVRSSRGGAKGGGATVTEAGRAVLAEYRGLEAEARRAGERHAARLKDLLSDIPDGK